MKPLASISLDLDNQWAYMKTHGDVGWEEFPSYLDVLIPYLLDVLHNLDLKITIFVVGQDVALRKNCAALRLLKDSGHELGNHSLSHEPWMHLYQKDKIEREILQTEEQIIRLTGQKPTGFRGPGFSWSEDLHQILVENGYMYDATTFPTYIVPVATAYHFHKSNLTSEERKKRKRIRGGFREALRPIDPYYWKLPSGGKMLEMPVTTVPILRMPFHMSYLLFLGRVSVYIMLLYLRIGLTMCRLTGTEPSFVIHPTDLLDSIQVPAMHFFPGMDLSADQKLQIFKKVIQELSKHFTLVNMRFHAESILQRNDIRIRCL